MRKLSILTCLVLLASPLAITQANAATPKLGGACSKVGTNAVAKGVKFTCVQSGMKLVWSKGVASTSTSTATNTSQENPIPITLPAVPTGLITFDNIDKHIADISEAAYTAVQKVEATNSLPNIPFVVQIGPNTNPAVPDVSAKFQKIMKLWSGFRQPVSYYALLYNFQDKDWALKTASKTPKVISTGGVEGLKNMMQQCSAPNKCSGANSGIGNEGTYGVGFGQFGMDPAHIAQDPYFLVGVIFGHEYTHSTQAAQFLGNPNIGKPNTEMQNKYGLSNSPSGLYEGALPCWFQEGQANFVGASAEASTLSDYLGWRVHMAKGHPIPEFTNYSAASLTNVLLTDNPPTCLSTPIYELGYGIGALVIEALTAIAGPQSTMAVVTLLGRGQTYEKAFQNVYGISWVKAVPILAKVAAAEYATTP